MEKKSSNLVEPAKKRRKVAMTKETTESLMKLQDLPVEVLAKIFNFLPSDDIRCRVFLVCKQFYEICQDQSWVPMKGLSIHGHNFKSRALRRSRGRTLYGLRNITAVSGLIQESRNLTSLKIKGLRYGSVKDLVSIALQACPKLINLEIVENSMLYGYRHDKEEMYWEEMEKENELMDIIKKFGSGLTGINLLMNGFGSRCLKAIIEGCPNLKNLTLEPFHDPEATGLWLVTFWKDGLKALSEGCKDLKNLKITKGCFVSLTKSDSEPLFPNCNLEINECLFDILYESGWQISQFNAIIGGICVLDDWEDVPKCTFKKFM